MSIISGRCVSRIRNVRSMASRSFAFPPTGSSSETSSAKSPMKLDLLANLKADRNTNTRGGSGGSNVGRNIEPRLVKHFNNESIYDPFDFSMERIILDRKHRSTAKPIGKINPMNLYLYPEILSKYVSSTGKILHSDVTGLSAKDQKRLSKAIRRCQAIGLLSKTSNKYNK